jgi:hypothetical protein
MSEIPSAVTNQVKAGHVMESDGSSSRAIQIFLCVNCECRAVYEDATLNVWGTATTMECSS